MNVFKFGGASNQHPEGFRNTARIIQDHAHEPLVVIVSAMGKTTNALEKVVDAFVAGHKDEALQQFRAITDSHIATLKALVGDLSPGDEEPLRQIFTEVEWLLHDKPVRPFDYYYDQIVCSGELMSTLILHQWLEKSGCRSRWLDVRDLMKTDDTFRDATIQMPQTADHIRKHLGGWRAEDGVVVTQGFIGSTDENESTTLGREGSDYSAAIFAEALGARALTIWKDVEAVMSADPRMYPEATNMPQLSYNEVIEMAFYGAQVIHPKTIKPLRNSNIPLLVKNFLNPTLPGTLISSQSPPHLPPIIVNKDRQVLVRFQSKDFSFMEGESVQSLNLLFGKHRTRPNLTQQTAISLLCCFDDHSERLHELAVDAESHFDVDMEKGLRLLTIRHYDAATLKKHTEGQTLILEQKTTETVQVLMR